MSETILGTLVTEKCVCKENGVCFCLEEIKEVVFVLMCPVVPEHEKI